MGYFSNGTEGELYEARYCCRCVHGDDDGAANCAVWNVHLLRNYDECNKDDSILHALIPRATDGSNQQCVMFVKRADALGPGDSPSGGQEPRG